MMTKFKSLFNAKELKQQFRPLQIKQTFSAKKQLINMLFGLIALFGLYLIVAWSSYTPLDNSWSTASFQTDTINKAGAFGAWIIDFFFVFFGRVGNLIPFFTFLVPLLLLRTKSAEQLTWLRFTMRFIGFIFLMIGLTSVSTLLFSNTNYYSAGGVIGGNLVLSVYPMLGKFGCILAGLALSLIGFILCSGASFIRLLASFYHWLTMQTPEVEKVEQDELNDRENEKELEPIIIEQPSTNSVASKTDNAENENNEESSNLVNVEQFINIQGLNSSEASSSSADSVHAFNSESMNDEDFSGFAVEQETLPQVRISNTNIRLPSEQDFVPVWKRQTSPTANVQLNDSSTNTHVDVQAEQEGLLDEHIPTVSLAPTNSAEKNTASYDVSVSLPAMQAENVANIDHHSLIQDEDEANFDNLAQQFQALEQQRLAEMEQQAKLMGEEDTLQVILNQSEDLKPIEPSNEAENATTTIKVNQDYKPYEHSLIHPAFQQPTSTVAKPTTPLPSLDLLEHRATQVQEITEAEIIETSHRIEKQLDNFNIKATVKDVLVGPVVTRYELELQPGVKASKVTGIDTDLARALMFRAIRVAEVIPGKPYIGIETPNLHRQIVPLREVLDSPEFKQSTALLPMALGKDISGKPVVVDLAKMPHLLVAGSTGSGKSVGVNTMILSLLFRVQPEEVRFIMIDPKVVELSIYNDIPHLLTPVVTDMKKAANALRWCVDEMERRYQLLSALRVRNIEGFNERIEFYENQGQPIPNPIWRPGDTMDEFPPPLEKLSYIVVIVDEFADLLMVAGKQVEELIARLAQKARAIGIHLILATQRPSVDVITGLIKANIPSRIAFTVASKIDSRTILDQNGAETLLGRGDMLYSGQGSSDLIRVHGAFMSDDEVARVADDWRARAKPSYIDGILDNPEEDEENNDNTDYGDGELDDLFNEVMDYVINTGVTSASAIQRKFRVGFNRAARIMDQLEEQGIVSAMQNGKREILARRPTDY